MDTMKPFDFFAIYLINKWFFDGGRTVQQSYIHKSSKINLIKSCSLRKKSCAYQNSIIKQYETLSSS